MEKIQSISEQTFNGGSYEGWIIKTNLQEIKIGISTGQSCCEQTGYIMSEDSIKDYIGARLKDIKIVDTALNIKEHVDTYDGGIMFVNIETNRGLLQFIVYNNHNGYYGHEAIVISEQLKYSENL